MAEVTETPIPTRREAAAERGRRTAILMVEDNADVRVMGAALLADAGFEVHAAVDAEAALAQVRAGLPFDLLFTDIVMPGGMDGVALAREVLRARPGLPVLLTTGWADRAMDHQDGRSGFDLIGKPYRQAELTSRIRGILGDPIPSL